MSSVVMRFPIGSTPEEAASSRSTASVVHRCNEVVPSTTCWFTWSWISEKPVRHPVLSPRRSARPMSGTKPVGDKVVGADLVHGLVRGHPAAGDQATTNNTVKYRQRAVEEYVGALGR